MRTGPFQFHIRSTVAENLISLKRGITLATEQGVKILLTQECALSGYPPLEVVNAGKIDFEEIKKAIAEIQGFAARSNRNDIEK
jgi:predicted amidohydrolase